MEDKKELTYVAATDEKTITILYGEETIGQFDKTGYLNQHGYLKARENAKTKKVLIEFDELVKPIVKCMRLPPRPEYKISQAASLFSDQLQICEMFCNIQPFFYTRQKIWWLWNFERFCWEMVDEIDLLNQISSNFSDLKTFEVKMKAEIINAMKQVGRKHTPIDAPKSWVQFKNHIYDLKNGETFEASNEYFITNPMQIEIGESEETPNIDRLFKEWVAEPYVPTLYEIIAYCLIPDYPLHRVFCLNGSGRNGKGSYLKIIKRLIGSKNICTTDLDTLLARPFESAKLYRKSVCIMGEINSGIFKNTQLLKRLTGEDLIGFEFKGKDGFDDLNYSKLIIATNKLPETPDKTTGFYSRWCILDFNNKFPETPGLIESIPDQEFNNLAKKSIRILKELLDRGSFTGEGDYEERARRYEERSNPIKDFIRDYCVEGQDYQTYLWKFKEEYISFLEQRKFRIPSAAEINRILSSKGFTMEIKHYEKDDGTRSTVKILHGIKLREIPIEDVKIDPSEELDVEKVVVD